MATIGERSPAGTSVTEVRTLTEGVSKVPVWDSRRTGSHDYSRMYTLAVGLETGDGHVWPLPGTARWKPVAPGVEVRGANPRGVGDGVIEVRALPEALPVYLHMVTSSEYYGDDAEPGDGINSTRHREYAVRIEMPGPVEASEPP